MSTPLELVDLVTVQWLPVDIARDDIASIAAAVRHGHLDARVGVLFAAPEPDIVGILVEWLNVIPLCAWTLQSALRSQSSPSRSKR